MRPILEILRAVAKEISTDRAMLVAAGCTFYLLLAIFPSMASLVSLYGLVLNPETVVDHIAFLGGLLPTEGMDIIRTQLESLAAADRGSLSFGFIFGLLVTLWSANSGVKTLFEAMNVAYSRTEQRSFIKLTLVTLGFTLGALVLAILLIVAVGVLPIVLRTVGLGRATDTLIELGRWPALFAVIVAGIAVLYRFGPTGSRPPWKRVIPGSILATTVWIVASIVFSWYLANFANYNATYGSLGAVIGFLMWTWISLFIIIAGAEFNAVMERRRKRQGPKPAPVTPPKDGDPQPATPIPASRRNASRWDNGAVLAGLLVAEVLRGRRRSD